MALVLMDLPQRFLEILIAPGKNLEMLWIIVPVYIAWVLGDIFQEKKGTDFGNAIQNGFVALWVGLDWGRQFTAKLNAITTTVLVQASLSIILVIYGFFIIIKGIKGSKVSKYFGRIREISYFIICLSPIFYGVVPIDLTTILTILIFFPIWYLIFEGVVRAIPTPVSHELAKEPEKFEPAPSIEVPSQPSYPQQPSYPTYPQQPQQQYPQPYQQPQQYPQQQAQQYPQQFQQAYRSRPLKNQKPQQTEKRKAIY